MQTMTQTQEIFRSSGADYAEFFEWKDANSNNEDRVGYFVTLDHDQIKLAGPNDYILGVISGDPSAVGNAGDDGHYMRDEFGRLILEYLDTVQEEVQIPEEILQGDSWELENYLRINSITRQEVDGQTKYYQNVTHVVDYPTDNSRYKVNPDYDSSQAYIERQDRQEWDVVGMIGILAVRDDGTCHPNEFCRVLEGGIASAASSEFSTIDGKVTKNYRVLQRVSDHTIKIIFR